MAVIEAVPYTIKNTNFMTSRWDVVVEPPFENPNLDGVPVLLKILRETVVASWPGSPPSCISCLAEHGSQDCPLKKTTLPDPDKSYANAAASSSSSGSQRKGPKNKAATNGSSSTATIKDPKRSTPPPPSSLTLDPKVKTPV